jgi:transcriptional regulator with GAF, ATPase, and Fis domain
VPRGATPAKRKVAARPSAARKPRSGSKTKTRTLAARLAQALEQQAATSEILRVISASPTDVQPVLDAVAEHAARLCKAPFARVLLAEGDRVKIVAKHAVDGSEQASPVEVPLLRTSVTGRAILTGEIVHHADVRPLLDSEFPDARNARLLSARAVLAVPLMRKGGAYGAIFLWRREPGLFAADQVALLQTFARQVGIAVDNVRLFKETKEALEQQTATSDILRAISRSPTDVNPVFETIAANALRLCDATFSTCTRFDGELIHLAALHHLKPEGVAAFRTAYPSPPSRGGHHPTSGAHRQYRSCRRRFRGPRVRLP